MATTVVVESAVPDPAPTPVQSIPPLEPVADAAALTPAVALGVDLGAAVARAEVTAEVATAEAIDWRTRAESAESERESLRAQVAALTPPPVVEEDAPTVELVDVASPTSEPPSGTPARRRGLLMKMFLG